MHYYYFFSIHTSHQLCARAITARLDATKLLPAFTRRWPFFSQLATQVFGAVPLHFHTRVYHHTRTHWVCHVRHQAHAQGVPLLSPTACRRRRECIHCGPKTENSLGFRMERCRGTCITAIRSTLVPSSAKTPLSARRLHRLCNIVLIRRKNI